jgi:hypothetical protein
VVDEEYLQTQIRPAALDEHQKFPAFRRELFCTNAGLQPAAARALFLYQGGYPKLDKDFAGYLPTPP